MASGDTLWVFGAADNRPPITNYATLDVRNGHLVLDFDDTTQETAVFEALLPAHYAGGGVTVDVQWATTSATTGTVGWTAEMERIGAAQDLDADGFGSATTITAATVPGTSGLVATTSAAIGDTDSLAVGESFRLRIRRDVSNDNAAGDAELLRVELLET